MNTEFQLLMNNPQSNEFMVAMKHIPLKEKKNIIKQIKKNQTSMKIDNFHLTLTTRDKNYYFDMSPYQKLMTRFKGEALGIGLVFMNENNEIAIDFVEFFVIKW